MPGSPYGHLQVFDSPTDTYKCLGPGPPQACVSPFLGVLECPFSHLQVLKSPTSAWDPPIVTHRCSSPLQTPTSAWVPLWSPASVPESPYSKLQVSESLYGQLQVFGPSTVSKWLHLKVFLNLW